MAKTKNSRDDSYVVIARRFRPRRFSEIVGQDPIVRTLRNEVTQNRFPHAWLFAGIRGVGKTTTARVLAKALNCDQGPTEEPCDDCQSCADITTGRSLDVLEIDGASNRGIDQIRELRETVRNYPARDRFRILIIDEVHMLTREAFNALLKTLEEPPTHVRFVLATTELHKVPDTIASRCQVFEFRSIPPKVLEGALRRISEKEGITISPRGLSLLARSAAGSLRDGQSHLDQAIAFCGKEIQDDRLEELLAVTNVQQLREFANGIADKDPKALLRLVDSMVQRGSEPVQFCRDLQAYFRDLLLVRHGVSDDGGSLILETDPAETQKLAGRFSEDQLIRVFQLLVQEEPVIRYATYPRYLLEVLAIKLARLADLTPIEEILAEMRSPTPRSMEMAPPQVEEMPAPDKPEAADRSPGTDRSEVARILQQLETRKASLSAFLGQASRFEIGPERIRIAFPERYSFYRETIGERKNLDLLRATCREVLNREVRIELAEEPDTTRDLGEVDEENHRQAAKNRLLDSAIREPVVQNLLDTFQGEIVELREADKTKP